MNMARYNNKLVLLANYGGIILRIMGNFQKHNKSFFSTAQKHNAQFLEHNSLMPSDRLVVRRTHNVNFS